MIDVNILYNFIKKEKNIFSNIIDSYVIIYIKKGKHAILCEILLPDNISKSFFRIDTGLNFSSPLTTSNEQYNISEYLKKKVKRYLTIKEILD